MTCAGFRLGCACSRCLERYLREFSNSCTYGTDPRLHGAMRDLAALAFDSSSLDWESAADIWGCGDG